MAPTYLEPENPPIKLREVLEEALKAVDLEPEDQAARSLALILAEQIDMASNPRTIAELSSKLTTILVELGMTPKARKAIKNLTKEVNGSDPDFDEAARILRELQNS